MTISDHTVSTRHLVDPEVAPMLDTYPHFEFAAATLPAIREQVNTPQPGMPDPAELYPDVTRTERFIPGLGSDPDVGILFYEPAGRATPTPAMVWIHGGGFIVGRAANDDLMCRRLAAQTGCVVASVDYRLAPETPAPGSVHDCYAALRWVHENAESLGVDTARVAIGGASAGGGLAACLAILARDRGEFPVSFQLLIYPMLDDRTASTVDAGPMSESSSGRPRATGSAGRRCSAASRAARTSRRMPAPRASSPWQACHGPTSAWARSTCSPRRTSSTPGDCCAPASPPSYTCTPADITASAWPPMRGSPSPTSAT